MSLINKSIKSANRSSRLGIFKVLINYKGKFKHSIFSHPQSIQATTLREDPYHNYHPQLAFELKT